MSKRFFMALLCAAILSIAYPISNFVGASAALPIPQSPPTIVLEPVVSGLSSTVFVTSAKDGTNRLFIIEQAGRIQVLQPGSSSPTLFLDISSKVLTDGAERGLLGLAFHPQFSINHRFFVDYTRKGDGAIVIAEYSASASNPNVALTTEIPILVVPHPNFSNHNGGMIAFGSDGYLYIGTGDGGSGNDPPNRAQNTEVLLGKILRIDIDHPNGSANYSSPSDNPFFGPTAGLDEIFAFGFRNPWRYSFDSVTGELWVGDVGQTAREEIDKDVMNGGNYGWRVMEGKICNPNFNGGVCTPPPGSILPVADYTHAGGRCAVTGGYVYRGARSALPVGTYVFADYCSGEIFMLDSNNQIPPPLLDTTMRISSFGEDEAGEIYVVSLGGAVNRITSSPSPAPCSFSLTPTSQSFTEDGGTGSIAVTTTGDCRWIAASNASWISIIPGTTSTGTGNGTVNFSVAANTSTRSRSGKINIGGETFVINQAASTAITISSLRLSTTILPGCQSLTGTVTLSAPVPSNTIVTLSDNIAATTLPATITVPAGETTKTFNITTAPVSSTQVGTVTARLGSSARGATLRVRPMTVSSLGLIPNPVVGPKPVTGKVVLECRAPSGGITVSLSSSNPAVAAPTVSSINFAAGVINKNFSIRTSDVPSTRTAIIKATANGITKSKVLTVN